MLDTTIHVHGVSHIRGGKDLAWLDLQDGKGHEVTVFPADYVNKLADGAAWWRKMAMAILRAVDEPWTSISIDSVTEKADA